MIVVDTGSIDRTVEIAMEERAKVFHFKWCDDFSKARNFSIAQSSSDWILIMDADNWLIEGGDYLKTLKNPISRVISICSTVVNEGPKLYVKTHKELVRRLFYSGVYFEGAVHEQAISVHLVKNTPIVFMHDGYMPEQKLIKHDRNFRMLEKMLCKEPNDPYLNYQIGKEYSCNLKDYEKALYHYRVAYQEASKIIPKKLPYYQQLLCGYLEILKNTKQFEEGLVVFEAEREVCGYPDFYFTFGDLALSWGVEMPEKADLILLVIESVWLHAMMLLSVYEGDGTQDLEKFVGYNLFIFYDCLGIANKAAEYKKYENLIKWL